MYAAQLQFRRVRVTKTACDTLQIDLSDGTFAGKNLSVSNNIAYKNEFGATEFETITAKSLDITSSDGSITLAHCDVDSVKIKNEFGRITADNLVSSKMDIDANDGDINLNGTFSGQTVIKNDFGNVTWTTSKPKEDYTYDLSTFFGSITVDDSKGKNRVQGSFSSENTLHITNSDGSIHVNFAQ